MRLLFAIFGLIFSAHASANYPQVEIKTTLGPILIELYPDKAPKTVENFLIYVKTDFYKGTIFHRVVNNFIIQGGGYSPDLKAKDTLPPIPNEATNGLKNDAGTVAMARSYDTHSATSQFFINVERNLFLNHHKPHPDYYGYTVFGKVLQGMDIVKKIAALPTTTAGPFFLDVPVQNIMIEDVNVIPEKTVEPDISKTTASKAKVKSSKKKRKS